MSLSDWKVLGNRLLLRPIKEADGTIYKPKMDDDAPDPDKPLTQVCEVMQVGPLAIGHGFEVGQHVIVLMNWAKVEIDGEILTVVDADDDALMVKSVVNGNVCAAHPLHEAGQCPHLDYQTPCNCFPKRTT